MLKLNNGLRPGADDQPKCFWCANHSDYEAYHDEEWGFPVKTDFHLFEKIALETFQSGLSWLTILRKRHNFRRAFNGFDFNEIAYFGEKDVERLLQDVSIVRHRGKIEAVVNNAKRAKELVSDEGSLAAYVWRYEPRLKRRPKIISKKALMSLNQTRESVALSKDLKKRGWRFIGPTTVYAFMQSMGLVNDHIEGCVIREVVETARTKFERPF
ncbi:MAG: DNA-3-methyladenine glycosylase I [Rhodospirillaceae bacterium]